MTITDSVTLPRSSEFHLQYFSFANRITADCGFIGKLYIFIALVDAKMIAVAVIALF